MFANSIEFYLDKIIIAGFFIMIFSSPISMASSSIGMGVAFLAWIVKKVKVRELNVKNNPLNIPILIFIIGILISFIDSHNISNSFKSLESYLFFFLLYYIIVDTITDPERAKSFIKVGFVAIIISSIYSILWQYYHLGMNRIDGGLMALDYGSVIMVFLIYTILFLFSEKKEINIIQLAFMTVLLSVTLLLNQTRGAWLGLVGSCSFILFYIKKKWVFIFLIILLILIMIAPGQIKQRIRSIFDIKNNMSNLGRIALWKGATFMFLDHPINGVGLGNFEDVYSTDYRQPNTTSMVHAHSNFFSFLAETGIVGFLGFLYLLYSMTKYLYVNLTKIDNSFYTLFVLATLGAIIGVYLIQGLTEYNFYRSIVGRLIWFLYGLSAVIINKYKGVTIHCDM